MRKKDKTFLEACGLFVEVVEGGWYLILCENIDDPPDDEDEEAEEAEGEAEEAEEGSRKKKSRKADAFAELKSVESWIKDCLYSDIKGTLLSSQRETKQSVKEHEAWKPLFEAMSEDSYAVSLYMKYSYLPLLNTSEIDRHKLSTIFNIRTAVACRLMYLYRLTPNEAREVVVDGRHSRFIDSDDASRLRAGSGVEPKAIVCHPENVYRLKRRQCDPLRFKTNLPPTFKITD